MSGILFVTILVLVFLSGIGIGMWIPRLMQEFNKRSRSRITKELEQWSWPEGIMSRSRSQRKR